MFERSYAKSLSNPHGIFGMIISKWLDYNLELYMDMEKYIENQRIKNVLEIGFGTGVGIKYLAERYQWHFDGIDRSRMMLKKAQKNNKEEIGERRIRLVCESIEDEEPILEKEYDLIFGINVLCFIEDIENALKKVYSGLNDNGQALFFLVGDDASRSQPISNTKYFIKRKEDDLKTLMERTGFEEVKLNEYEKRKGRYYLSGRKRIRPTIAST